MNAKLLLSTLLLFFGFSSISQTQIGILKDPQWKVMSAYDSKYGTTTPLSNKSIAMIVDVPDQDFAIATIDAKLTQLWLTPLKGFPLAIGKFKGKVLVVAAADRSFSKSFVGPYIAYLLEEGTGKVFAEKIIYEGSQTYLEDPDFFFAEDGEYFRMSTRLTAMKRKFKFYGVDRSHKDYRGTQNFSMINFDKDLNQKERIDPVMPEGDTWSVSSCEAGSFLITALDKANKKLTVASYIPSIAEPVKSVSIPLNLDKSTYISTVHTAGSPSPFVNHIAFTYTNSDKKKTLFVGTIDFKTGQYQSDNEVFDKDHQKELRKSFVAFDKKFDDLEFNEEGFLGVRHIAEYDGKLLVSLADSYVKIGSRGGSAAFETSTLINVYDGKLKKVYYQFLPRKYMSGEGEGNEIAYSLKNNTMRMIANSKPGMFSNISFLYFEMDFSNGKLLKVNKIPKEDIKAGYHANTSSILWYDDTCLIPYFAFKTILSSKIGAQLQLLN